MWKRIVLIAIVTVTLGLTSASARQHDSLPAEILTSNAISVLVIDIEALDKEKVEASIAIALRGAKMDKHPKLKNGIDSYGDWQEQVNRSGVCRIAFITYSVPSADNPMKIYLIERKGEGESNWDTMAAALKRMPNIPLANMYEYLWTPPTDANGETKTFGNWTARIVGDGSWDLVAANSKRNEKMERLLSNVDTAPIFGAFTPDAETRSSIDEYLTMIDAKWTIAWPWSPPLAQWKHFLPEDGGTFAIHLEPEPFAEWIAAGKMSADVETVRASVDAMLLHSQATFPFLFTWMPRGFTVEQHDDVISMQIRKDFVAAVIGHWLSER